MYNGGPTKNDTVSVAEFHELGCFVSSKFISRIVSISSKLRSLDRPIGDMGARNGGVFTTGEGVHN